MPLHGKLGELGHAYTSSANVLMCQTKALKAGSYTFSAYVKTAFASTPGSGGAFLSVYNSNLGPVKIRVVNETTNTQIENGWERISVSLRQQEIKCIIRFPYVLMMFT